MKMTLPRFAPTLGAIVPILIELDGSESPGGTVVVTPADGSTGTFSPTTLSLTNTNRSGTILYSPPSAGSFTISITNNGGLTNPSSKVLYSPHNKTRKGNLVLSGLTPNTAYRIRRLGDVSNELVLTTDALGNASTQALQPNMQYVVYGPSRFRKVVTLDRENVVVEPSTDPFTYLQVSGYQSTQYRIDPVGHHDIIRFVTTSANGGNAMVQTKRNRKYRISTGSIKKVVLMDNSKAVIVI